MLKRLNTNFVNTYNRFIPTYIGALSRAPIEFTNIESYSIRRQIEPNRIEDTNSNSGRIEQ